MIIKRNSLWGDQLAAQSGQKEDTRFENIGPSLTFTTDIVRMP